MSSSLVLVMSSSLVLVMSPSLSATKDPPCRGANAHYICRGSESSHRCNLELKEGGESLGSLVVKATGSWSSCHFRPSAAENPL
ncbi:hypothetical protein TNCV_2441581 [Trichonephila clavipes]|nr:hypothetical protein TNCV_2441581 [Trichonephila clavipes]